MPFFKQKKKTNCDGDFCYLAVEVMLPNGHFNGGHNGGCIEVIITIVMMMMIMILNDMDN